MLYLNTHIQEYDETRLASCMTLLPEWRRTKVDRIKHLQGRRESALAYIELMRGLSSEYGMTEIPCFDYNAHGKPFLKDYPHIHFSISHSKVAAGCLISDTPCGMDVETVRKASPELIRYCMNEEEEQMILSSPTPDVAFTRLWTRKEAVYKLLGTGIDDGLRNILHSDIAQMITVTTTEDMANGYILSEARATDANYNKIQTDFRKMKAK